MGLTKTNSKIKLGLVELTLKIPGQYLLWWPSNWFFSVGLRSKWLTGGSTTTHGTTTSGRVGFCDNNVHPSSLAFICLGLSNFFIQNVGTIVLFKIWLKLSWKLVLNFDKIWVKLWSNNLFLNCEEFLAKNYSS